MNLTGKPPLGLKVGNFESQVLRDFARGKYCQMQSEWCNHNPATVVLCHSRRRAGAGMSEKPDDFWAYHGCSACHANEHKVSDGMLYDAIRKTQALIYRNLGTLTP